MRVYIVMKVEKDSQEFEEEPVIHSVYSTLRAANDKAKQLQKKFGEPCGDIPEFRVKSFKVH